MSSCLHEFRKVDDWRDTADRKWTEYQCKHCGVLERYCDGRPWRILGKRRSLQQAA